MSLSKMRRAVGAGIALSAVLLSSAASAGATAPTSAANGGSGPVAGEPAVGSGHSCRAAGERQIARLFDRWNASLATRDPDRVVRNYAPGSVLLPTLSNTPRDTPAEQRAYFEEFLRNEPVGQVVERHIDIDCRTAVDTGLYSFTFGTDGRVVPARYTFTYRWLHGRWLITSHHSSLMPEGAGGGEH